MPLKIKITYTEEEKALFERIRAELIQTVPGKRLHESNAPGGLHVWYLTSHKKEKGASMRVG